MPVDGYALTEVLPASQLVAQLEDWFADLLSQLTVVDARFDAVESAAVRALTDAALGEMDPEDSVGGEEPAIDLPAMINPTALPPDDPAPEALTSGASSSAGAYRMHLSLSVEPEVVVPVPGCDWAALVVAAQAFDATVEFSEAGFRATLAPALVVRLQQGVLVPVRPSTGGGFEPDPGATTINLVLSSPGLTLNDRGEVSISTEVGVDLPMPVMIGSTGIVIAATGVRFDLSAAGPALLIGEARVTLPDDVPVPAGLVVSMTDARLDATGFSGAASLDLDLTYDESGSRSFYSSATGGQEPASLFGLPGGVRHFALGIERNTLVASDIRGELLVPYFGEPVGVELTFTASGDLRVALSSTDESGASLMKDELLALTLKSLEISKEGTTGAVVLSGSLEPLLMASDGLKWPKLDVEDLYIDSNGRFRIREAWIDLKDLATLDLWGFHFELRRVGLGFEESRDRLWLDLSGGLHLIEQIPVGLDVEGFRLTWPRTLLVRRCRHRSAPTPCWKQPQNSK